MYNNLIQPLIQRLNRHFKPNFLFYLQGYLRPMRSRPDLFSPQRIQAIFGNLEDLYRFQKNLLVDLEHSLNWNSLEDSVVGGCFLQHVRIYNSSNCFLTL